MFKFIINSIEVTQGIANWQDLKIAIKRDVANRVVRVEMPQEMTFTGECYEIINDIYNSDGYCALIPVEIRKEISNNSVGYKSFFNGIIFINECEFNDDKKQVIVPIRDNSFISRINNNRAVEMYTDTNLTKNGLSMTAVAPFYSSFFNTSNGVVNSGFAHSGDRLIYDWFELVNNCVKFITDNELTVVSDWYTNLADADKIGIVQGYELRTATGTDEQFFISFDKLTKDIFKGFNLWMTIEGSTVRIEQESYFFDTNILFQLDNVPDVIRTFSQANFYSNVLLGSASSIDIGAIAMYQGVNFTPENYYFGGKCNINNTFDLKFQDLITDVNLIQDILVNDTDTYDDEIFVIQYTGTTDDATKYPLTVGIGVTVYFYNYSLININIYNRYNFNVTGYIVTNSLTDKFMATATIDGAWVPPIVYGFTAFNSELLSAATVHDLITFLDESTPPNFDNDGRFTPNLGDYSVNTTGLYSFYFNITFSIQNLVITTSTGNNKLQIYVRSLTSGVVTHNTLLSTINGIDTIETNGTYTMEGYVEDVFLVAGSTFSMRRAMYCQTEPISGSETITGEILYRAGSYIKCIKTPTGGGEIGDIATDVFKASIFTFDKKLTQSEVDLLLDAPYKAFTVNNKKVWANEITINLRDNSANIEAISDIDNSG